MSRLGIPELLVIGVLFMLVAGPAALVLAIILIVRHSRKPGVVGDTEKHP